MARKKANKPLDTNGENANEISNEGVALPIRWNTPKDIPTLHATNLTVQHTKDEFVVMFFEIRPPVILNSEDAKRFVEENGAVDAECLARLVITPDRMRDFLKALQENYDKFESNAEDGKE